MPKATRVASTTRIVAASITVAVSLFVAFPPDHAVLAADSPAPAWDQHAAARYLDSREVWWQNWDHAKRDHGTRCVSCHTQTPYALARPALRGSLGESAPSPMESAMLADVEKRV